MRAFLLDDSEDIEAAVGGYTEADDALPDQLWRDEDDEVSDGG